jgi:hypothetical protein
MDLRDAAAMLNQHAPILAASDAGSGHPDNTPGSRQMRMSPNWDDAHEHTAWLVAFSGQPERVNYGGPV